MGVYEFSEEYAITFCMDFLIWTINIIYNYYIIIILNLIILLQLLIILYDNFEFDIKMFKLRLWDTAGSEWFRSVTKEYYSDSCTAIIIYDITDENLFKSVKNWIDDCQSYANKNRILF